MRRLESQPRNALDVITPAQDGHLPKLCVGPSREIVLATPREVPPSHLVAVAVPIELEEDVLAAKDEEIRVLGDHPVHDALAFEVGKLGVGFIGRDEVLRSERLAVGQGRAERAHLDALATECLQSKSVKFKREEGGTHLDQLERHLGRHVDSLDEGVPRLAALSLGKERVPFRKRIGPPPIHAIPVSSPEASLRREGTHFSRSSSVPILDGSNPPSNTIKGVTP